MSDNEPELNDDTKKLFDQMKQLLNEEGEPTPDAQTTDAQTADDPTIEINSEQTTSFFPPAPSFNQTPPYTYPQDYPQAGFQGHPGGHHGASFQSGYYPTPQTSSPQGPSAPKPRVGLILWGVILILAGMIPLMRTIFPSISAPSASVFLLASLGIILISAALATTKKKKS